MSGGKLVKMVVEAYKSGDFKSKVGDFTFQVNPEKYGLSYKKGKKIPKSRLANGDNFGRIPLPQDSTLNLEFILDSTGIIPGCDDVVSTVNNLKSLCLDINGDSHTNNFLKVKWGSNFTFPSKMESLSVNYELFKPDGTPIRAKLKAAFKFFENSSTTAKKTKKRSPDLTHMREVKAGESLPAMCYEIYGDPKYYIQVARVNNLVSFRELKPGMKLMFPKLQR